jgi:diguanylate cyclase (GGDEF)-like protein
MVAERAFIIDSKPEDIRKLSHFLKKMGLFVEEETDAPNALERLRNGNCEFDIIFIEQKMDTMNGVEMLKALQSFDCKSCVIFMTEKPDIKTVVSAMQEGAFSFLKKPIHYNQLDDAVQKGLDNRRAFFEILEMSEKLKESNSKLKRQSTKLKSDKIALNKTNQKLNLLNQLSLEINSTLDAHKMVDKIAHSELHELVEYDIATFFYFFGEDAFLKIDSPSFSLSGEVIEQLQQNSIDEHYKRTGQKLSACDIHTEVIKRKAQAGKNQKAPSLSAKKSLHIPLKVANNVLGIMGLIYTGAKKTGEKHPNLISTVANQLALALNIAKEHQKIQALASTDALTGLYNRRAFNEMLDKELRRSSRYQKPLSLIMLDIDAFKEINDSFGHKTGDNVLKSLAVCLQGAIRDTDFLARYGGDEFAVILPETKAEEASVLAERLQQTVKDSPVTVNGSYRNITLSMGVTDISSATRVSEDELINRVDKVLYLSKERGGNSVEVLCNT